MLTSTAVPVPSQICPTCFGSPLPHKVKCSPYESRTFGESTKCTLACTKCSSSAERRACQSHAAWDLTKCSPSLRCCRHQDTVDPGSSCTSNATWRTRWSSEFCCPHESRAPCSQPLRCTCAAPTVNAVCVSRSRLLLATWVCGGGVAHLLAIGGPLGSDGTLDLVLGLGPKSDEHALSCAQQDVRGKAAALHVIGNTLDDHLLMAHSDRCRSFWATCCCPAGCDWHGCTPACCGIHYTPSAAGPASQPCRQPNKQTLLTGRQACRSFSPERGTPLGFQQLLTSGLGPALQHYHVGVPCVCCRAQPEATRRRWTQSCGADV